MPFRYQNGILSVRSQQGERPLSELIHGRSEPFYVYSQPSILERIEWYRSAFQRPIKIRFAVKANPFLPLLKEMAQQKVGADVVSGGELLRAQEAGISPQEMVFSGVGKSVDELTQAATLNIGQINVESIPELARLAEIVRGQKRRVRVGLRLNPDVAVNTHPYISTGQLTNKFGLDVRQLPEAIGILRTQPEDLHFSGLAIHLGSQITDSEPVLQAIEWLKNVFVNLRKEGWPLQSLDIGGGLGIDYQSENEKPEQERLSAYGASVDKILNSLNCDLIVEPGRFLTARSGALLTKIEYVKETPQRRFVIVNAGMNHLLRPALYQADHRILAVKEAPGKPEMICDIVGPICESSDVFGRERRLRQPQAGDWLAVLDSGAYGYSMASQYNLRPLPEQVLC